MSNQATPEIETGIDMDRAREVTLHLINAANELFGETANAVTLPTSQIHCEFYPAKFRHLEEITVLFESMVAGFQADELKQMLLTVSKNQEELINQGASPYTLNTGELVRSAANNSSLALKLLRGCTRTLPDLAGMFTSLTPEQFHELDADEAMVVAMGIFSRNYNFFTQRLLPVIVAFTASLHQKRS
jgi:hypothetical protein